MRYMLVDKAIKWLRAIQKSTDNKDKAILADAIAEFIDKCPCVRMEKLTFCNECCFCGSDMRCTHKHGLQGKLQPDFHCSWGSPYNDGSNEEDFSEAFDIFNFDEDEEDEAAS